MKLFKLTTVLLVLFLGAGCVTQKRIERDIERTGRNAFNDWSSQQELSDQPADTLNVQRPGDETTEPLLEGELSLPDAIKLALQFNRELQVELEQRSVARGQTLSAAGDAFLSVQATGGYDREEDMSGFIVDGEEVTVDNLDTYSATLSVELPLFSGGRNISALKTAQYFKMLTEKNIQAAVEETIYQTIRSYYDVLLLLEEQKVAQNLVELNEQLYRDVVNNEEVGIATRFNVLVARVDLSNARTQLQVAQKNVDQAKAQFLRQLGVSQISNIKLTDELQFTPVIVSQQSAVQKALTNRPEVAGSQMEMKIQAEQLRSQYSRYAPDVSAYFDNTWGRPHPGYSSANEVGRFWNTGIRLSWDIFNLSREGSIIQERAALKQQQIQFYDTQEAVLFEVQSAILAIENARESIESQQLTLEQANEGLRRAQVGLREGTLTQVEVQEAQQSFSGAQLSYLNSLYNYEVARLDLQRATGELRYDNRVDANIIDDLER